MLAGPINAPIVRPLSAALFNAILAISQRNMETVSCDIGYKLASQLAFGVSISRPVGPNCYTSLYLFSTAITFNANNLSHRLIAAFSAVIPATFLMPDIRQLIEYRIHTDIYPPP